MLRAKMGLEWHGVGFPEIALPEIAYTLPSEHPAKQVLEAACLTFEKVSL